MMRRIISFLLAIVLIGILGWLAYQLLGKNNDIQLARHTLMQVAKDPQSVKVSNVVKRSNGAICGMYNAKNAFGGYAGFQPFAVLSDGKLVLIPPKPPEPPEIPVERLVSMSSSQLERRSEALQKSLEYLREKKRMIDICAP